LYSTGDAKQQTSQRHFKEQRSRHSLFGVLIAAVATYVAFAKLTTGGQAEWFVFANQIALVAVLLYNKCMYNKTKLFSYLLGMKIE
jgi:hypothetical protein